MKRAKARPFRAELRLGDLTMPLERAYETTARQLRALAALKSAEGADFSEVRRLKMLASIDEREARKIIVRRAIHEHKTTKRSEGGKKTAKQRKAEAEQRQKKIDAEVAKVRLEDGPSVKKEYIADVLHERGFGGKAALLKLIR